MNSWSKASHLILWCGNMQLPMEPILLYCIYCDRWMISEVYRVIFPAQIQPTASKLIGRCFTVQVYNDPKHTSKATQGKEVECSALAKAVTWPEATRPWIWVAEGKSKDETSQEHSGSENLFKRIIYQHTLLLSNVTPMWCQKFINLHAQSLSSLYLWIWAKSMYA